MSKTTKLTHPSISSFSFGGVEYKASQDGAFDLPDDAAAVAVRDFGFVAPSEAVPAAPKRGRKAAAESEQPQE